MFLRRVDLRMMSSAVILRFILGASSSCSWKSAMWVNLSCRILYLDYDLSWRKHKNDQTYFNKLSHLGRKNLAAARLNRQKPSLQRPEMFSLVYCVTPQYLWAYNGAVRGVQLKCIARAPSTHTCCRHSLSTAPQFVSCAATCLMATCGPARNALCPLLRRSAGTTWLLPQEMREVQIHHQIFVERFFLFCFGTGAAFSITSNSRAAPCVSFQNREALASWAHSNST